MPHWKAGRWKSTIWRPRLKELRGEQRELSQRMDEALDEVNETRHEPLDAAALEKYVADLQSLLGSASFLECKAFLASFVRRVEFDQAAGQD